MRSGGIFGGRRTNTGGGWQQQGRNMGPPPPYSPPRSNIGGQRSQGFGNNNYRSQQHGFNGPAGAGR